MATETFIEQWVPIKGYEDLYQISNTGKVKALSKTVNIGFGRWQYHPEKEMKINKASHGYLMVRLTKDKVSMSFLVHRLVCSYFNINEIGSHAVVNHKDGNKFNNSADNVEWCTYSENSYHAYENGLKTGAWKGKFGYDHHRSKAVIQYNLDDVVIKEFGSIRAAMKETGFAHYGIWYACNTKGKIYKGFLWGYKN